MHHPCNWCGGSGIVASLRGPGRFGWLPWNRVRVECAACEGDGYMRPPTWFGERLTSPPPPSAATETDKVPSLWRGELMKRRCIQCHGELPVGRQAYCDSLCGRLIVRDFLFNLLTAAVAFAVGYALSKMG